MTIPGQQLVKASMAFSEALIGNSSNNIIVINGELPSLNEYTNANRNNKFGGAIMKKESTDLVAWQVKGIEKVKDYPIILSFDWYTKDLRKDTDNIAFAKKFIQDGLVKAGIIEDDRRKFIAGYGGERFFVDKENPRVEITIKSV